MAEHDLDAALQLLAERAQYITGASGAAIALRRGQHNDMLCRASAGASAPELGTLLSMEYGFTGESVRTRQTLFCKDAETDSRVNREGCKKLGIASVVAMPIMCEGQALGVFELFSGKPSAFVERDFTALRRLGEMVETAVKLAAAGQTLMTRDTAAPASFESAGAISVESSLSEAKAGAGAVSTSDSNTAAENDSEIEEKTEPERTAPKPLYWSVAMQTEGGQAPAPETRESIPVPAVLRDLRKCQACGFPVSQGRTLCVDCEEKQRRGQLAGKSNAGVTGELRKDVVQSYGPQILRNANPEAAEIEVAHGEASAVKVSPDRLPVAETIVPNPTGADLQNRASINNSKLFLSVAAQSESWLAANKFILPALLLVAIIIAAIAWLR